MVRRMARFTGANSPRAIEVARMVASKKPVLVKEALGRRRTHGLEATM